MNATQAAIRAGYSELIDTLWNVNWQRGKRTISICLELIDTLWNVNVYHNNQVNLVFSELIDTLWNVNLVRINPHIPPGSGINRYIMECKFRSALIRPLRILRINRYIMECKSSSTPQLII